MATVTSDGENGHEGRARSPTSNPMFAVHHTTSRSVPSNSWGGAGRFGRRWFRTVVGRGWVECRSALICHRAEAFTVLSPRVASVAGVRSGVHSPEFRWSNHVVAVAARAGTR